MDDVHWTVWAQKALELWPTHVHKSVIWRALNHYRVHTGSGAGCTYS